MSTSTLSALPKIALPASLRPNVGDWPCAFQMLPVAALMVRKSYQRDLTAKSGRTAISIAKDFSWSKFGCLIVRAVEAGGYEVIDGQHRAIAAKMIELADVPAIIVTDAAADTFLGINKTRTALSPLAIFRAELAAEHPVAVKIARIAKAADVHIRTSNPPGALPVGQTIAISAIRTVMTVEGERRLGWALQALRQAEANATPLDASRLTSTNIRAAAETAHVIDNDWVGEKRKMVDAMAAAFERISEPDLREKIAAQMLLTGEGKWKCCAAIITTEVRANA